VSRSAQKSKTFYGSVDVPTATAKVRLVQIAEEVIALLRNWRGRILDRKKFKAERSGVVAQGLFEDGGDVFDDGLPAIEGRKSGDHAT
jgi:hypothetical protein